MEAKDQIIIYQTTDGTTFIEVKLENDTIWLTQAQMQELFSQTKQFNLSAFVSDTDFPTSSLGPLFSTFAVLNTAHLF